MTKKEKIMAVIVGLCILYFAISDPYYFWKTKPTEESKDSNSAGVQIAEPLAVGATIAQAGLLPRKHQAPRIWQRKPILSGWQRDPFVMARPDLDADALVAGMRLGVISVRGEDRMALINSKPVRVGDSISGMKITSIESDRVILNTGTRSVTLTWER